MHCLVTSAKELLKEAKLQKHRIVFEDARQDELQVKTVCWSLSPRV